MFDEECDRCGFAPCRCDRENDDGYECGRCGYVPTWRELHNGSCRNCKGSVSAEVDDADDTDDEES